MLAGIELVPSVVNHSDAPSGPGAIAPGLLVPAGSGNSSIAKAADGARSDAIRPIDAPSTRRRSGPHRRPEGSPPPLMDPISCLPASAPIVSGPELLRLL